MATYKNPLDQANDILALNPENRRKTLNKRINQKGNYEIAVSGGSHALDNQAQIWDKNNIANTMAIADPNGVGADWTLPAIKKNIEGLNDRYENRKGQNIQYSPKTRRGRRLLNLYSKDPRWIADEIVEQINKYEGVK